jgi:hypothetical protein
MVTYPGVVDVGYVMVDITFKPQVASKGFAQSESGTNRTREVIDLDDKEGSNVPRVESLCLRGADFAETNDGTKFGGERVFPRYDVSSGFLWWSTFTQNGFVTFARAFSSRHGSGRDQG